MTYYENIHPVTNQWTGGRRLEETRRNYQSTQPPEYTHVAAFAKKAMRQVIPRQSHNKRPSGQQGVPFEVYL